MRITYDPAKRLKTLAERKVDFDDARGIFAGVTFDFRDDRKDYGEVRMVTIGRIDGRMMVVVWTPRGNARHIISMRKANEREEARYAQRLV
jgi:uncharacterized DUF497 family protein